MFFHRLALIAATALSTLAAPELAQAQNTPAEPGREGVTRPATGGKEGVTRPAPGDPHHSEHPGAAAPGGRSAAPS